MRQVDVRVSNPAIRYQESSVPLAIRWVDVHQLLGLLVLCAFWGVVIYLGLVALG